MIEAERWESVLKRICQGDLLSLDNTNHSEFVISSNTNSERIKAIMRDTKDLTSY